MHQSYATTTRWLDRSLPPMRPYEKAKRIGIWNPSDINLSKDKADWTTLKDDEEDLILRLPAMFVVGEEAAKRETMEEVNLEVGEMSIFGVFAELEHYYKYPNGDEVYNVTIVYLSHDWGGEVKLNDEHTGWRWFSAGEIPEDISPPIRPIIERFKRLVNQED